MSFRKLNCHLGEAATGQFTKHREKKHILNICKNKKSTVRRS